MKSSTPANRLNDLLTVLDISQKEFAGSVSLTPATISRMLNGETNFDKNFAYSLAHIFKVNPTWLINGVGSMFLKNEKPLVREDIKELIPTLEKFTKPEIAKLKKLIEAYLQ